MEDFFSHNLIDTRWRYIVPPDKIMCICISQDRNEKFFVFLEKYDTYGFQFVPNSMSEAYDSFVVATSVAETLWNKLKNQVRKEEVCKLCGKVK